MSEYIKSYNIANSSIIAASFDSATSNSINVAAVAFTSANAANALAQAANTLIASQTLQIANAAPIINVISITDSSYNVLDDTAANTTGAYIQVTGSNFQSGVIVMVGTSNTAVTTTLVNSTTLRAQIPAIASGTYPVYVVNTNGGTGIRVNGLTTSAFPAWSTGATLSNQASGTSFGINVSATSDSNITYANTTVLPTGTTLLSNGYFYGTVTIGTQTTYNFDIDAKDAENQDATRTFSMTVTVPPPTILYGWGSSNNGELGYVSATLTSSPVQIDGSSIWSSTSVGYNGIDAGIKTDGTLWTWGNNYAGQLGQNNSGTNNNRSSPTQVGVLTTWSKIITGTQSCFAIKTDGTLWAWGINSLGMLGLGNLVYRSSPTQIGSLSNWAKVIGLSYATLAIKTDGTLWAWGNNFQGQLGQNNSILRSSPVQVGSLTNWSNISGGLGHFIALKTDGTLWACGRNTHGELGTNDNVNYRSSPVQIGSGTTWSLVNNTGTYTNTSLAIKTDGTLWGWGLNSQGQLAQNDVAHRSSPVQVGVGSTWLSASASYFGISGIKNNKTLWFWGATPNDFLYRSSPIQVESGTNWSRIVSTYSHFVATYGP